MIKKVLAGSRYLILIAVFGSFLAATALLVYGGIEVVVLIKEAIAYGEVSQKGAKSLALAFIEMVDLFLLGTVFYIVALGLYELFIDDSLVLPAWLEIRDLDGLKNKLVGVVVVVLAVTFLGQVVTWDGERDLLGLGVGIAVVIAALTWFLGLKGKKGNGGKKYLEE
ncbi:Uncharacterized membrane protein YqhA [Geoalkalibacter ferrihydriticus]|uniref:YqhA family protein n=2 Tax=Geoalkalibacter ferrihydriticus TaxID=392333 RepID=A0A0C2HZ03_9BACT|nr:YqhA family protein [Geoalkalibacter ferrihydriticus]KIH77982.1 hypothetical protein GFER_05095 [Geoalkalibacter ferrihydriticus DSM 17813]SDM34320.1 Uncharacterized membrane protein YqhA [Geoalkalibacter ferrihydriticus]